MFLRMMLFFPVHIFVLPNSGLDVLLRRIAEGVRPSRKQAASAQLPATSTFIPPGIDNNTPMVEVDVSYIALSKNVAEERPKTPTRDSSARGDSSLCVALADGASGQRKRWRTGQESIADVDGYPEGYRGREGVMIMEQRQKDTDLVKLLSEDVANRRQAGGNLEGTGAVEEEVNILSPSNNLLPLQGAVHCGYSQSRLSRGIENRIKAVSKAEACRALKLTGSGEKENRREASTIVGSYTRGHIS